jgi:hypothetical protein
LPGGQRAAQTFDAREVNDAAAGGEGFSQQLFLGACEPTIQDRGDDE